MDLDYLFKWYIRVMRAQHVLQWAVFMKILHR